MPGEGTPDRVRELKNELLERRHQLRSALRSTSTLPFDTFQTSDPMLESTVLDSAVEIFLKHLTAPRASLPEVDVDALPKREQISEEEMQRCIDTISAWEPIEPPEIGARLDEERMWILADLSQSGHGLTRQRATAELRLVLDQLWADQVEVHLLKSLVQSLQLAEDNGEVNALLQILLKAASTSLERLQAE